MQIDREGRDRFWRLATHIRDCVSHDYGIELLRLLDQCQVQEEPSSDTHKFMDASDMGIDVCGYCGYEENDPIHTPPNKQEAQDETE